MLMFDVGACRVAWWWVPLLIGLAAVPSAAAAEAERIAVFDFELVDTSLGGELRGTDPADEARLRMVTAELRDQLEASDRFEVVPVASSSVDIRGDLRDCIECAVDAASEFGADLVALGWVQKVSNLILNMNLVIHDVATGERVFASGVDLRGNTDESWTRALRFMLKRMLARPGGEPG